MRMVWSVVLVAVLGLSCREHTLEEGEYRLELEQTLRDDCQLAPSALRSTFRREGHLVYLTLDAPLLTLRGSYAYGNEELFLDGSLSKHPFTVAGQACLVDVAQYHLDGRTLDAQTFEAELSIVTTASMRDGCSCSFFGRYRAQRQ